MVLPHWARNYHLLGWHGEDLASYFLQWASNFPRRALHSFDRSPIEPKGKQRKDDPNHVWNFLRPCYVCCHSSCPFLVCFRYISHQDFITILLFEDVQLVLFLTLVMVFRIPSQFMKVMLFPTPSFVSILRGVTSLNTWWKSWPSEVIPSPSQPSEKSFVTWRKSLHTSPKTTTRNWQKLKEPELLTSVNRPFSLKITIWQIKFSSAFFSFLRLKFELYKQKHSKRTVRK